MAFVSLNIRILPFKLIFKSPPEPFEQETLKYTLDQMGKELFVRDIHVSDAHLLLLLNIHIYIPSNVSWPIKSNVIIYMQM
jgi:hypothetical protein